MSQTDRGREFTDTEEVADFIVDEFAAENKGVAEVIPSDVIRSRLERVVQQSDAFGQADWDDLYIDVKDAVLERGVIIA